MIKIAHNMALKNIPYLFCPEKPGPSPRSGIFDGPSLSSNCGSQRYMSMPWSFVSKITNSKHQITNKSQITNHKFKTGSTRSAGACAA